MIIDASVEGRRPPDTSQAELVERQGPLMALRKALYRVANRSRFTGGAVVIGLKKDGNMVDSW